MPTPFSRFLAQSDKIWGDLPYRQKQVLQAVLRHDSPIKLQVGDFLRMSEIASPATMHLTVSQLVKSGHLKSALCGDDGRTKCVALTPKSLAIFAKLEKALLSSIKP